MNTSVKQGWVPCSWCAGSGLVETFGEGPAECRHCTAGSVWRYSNGALAVHYAGPLCGTDKRALLKGDEE